MGAAVALSLSLTAPSLRIRCRFSRTPAALVVDRSKQTHTHTRRKENKQVFLSASIPFIQFQSVKRFKRTLIFVPSKRLHGKWQCNYHFCFPLKLFHLCSRLDLVVFFLTVAMMTSVALLQCSLTRNNNSHKLSEKLILFFKCRVTLIWSKSRHKVHHVSFVLFFSARSKRTTTTLHCTHTVSLSLCCWLNIAVNSAIFFLRRSQGASFLLWWHFLMSKYVRMFVGRALYIFKPLSPKKKNWSDFLLPTDRRITVLYPAHSDTS